MFLYYILGGGCPLPLRVWDPGKGHSLLQNFFLHFSRKNAGFMHFYGEKNYLLPAGNQGLNRHPMGSEDVKTRWGGWKLSRWFNSPRTPLILQMVATCLVYGSHNWRFYFWSTTAKRVFFVCTKFREFCKWGEIVKLNRPTHVHQTLSVKFTLFSSVLILHLCVCVCLLYKSVLCSPVGLLFFTYCL